jgi:hypothetical protein
MYSTVLTLFLLGATSPRRGAQRVEEGAACAGTGYGEVADRLYRRASRKAVTQIHGRSGGDRTHSTSIGTLYRNCEKEKWQNEDYCLVAEVY